MPYFHVSLGLRGCYLPDDAWVAKIDTRRDLKQLALAEIETAADADGRRPKDCASKRHAAAWAAEVWRHRDKLSLPLVLPLGPGYGLHVSTATRAEFSAFQKKADW